MSEKVKCAATKWSVFWDTPRQFCKNAGTLEHDGQMYCKVHHEPTRKARAEASYAAWKADYDKAAAARKAAAEAAAAQAADAARFRWLVDADNDMAYHRLLSAFAERESWPVGKHEDGTTKFDREPLRAAFDRVMAREGGA